MPGVTILARRALDRYRSDGVASTIRAAARHVLRTWLRKLEEGGGKHSPEKKKIRNLDLSAYKASPNVTKETIFDVILATDLRFPGGSSSSSAQEATTQGSAGLKSGLYHVPSEKMRYRTSLAPIMDSIVKTGHADLLNNQQHRLRTRILIFRHPSILNPDIEDLPDIEADQVVLIINHPPVKFGKIEYLLPHAIRRLRKVYGREPLVYPIGPLVRAEINEFYDDGIFLAESDWVNIFDLERFSTNRSFRGFLPLRIGRHSRPNKEKWPSDPDDIRAAYPDKPGIEVHVLGGADIPETLLGKLPSNWTVHEFGAKDVVEFLREIDVFVYFHHPDWVEAFGRVIVEAMAAGLPVILPPHFEPLLGDAALYCEPEGVANILDQLRDPTFYMLRSKASRDTAVRRFSTQVHLDRLRALGGAPQASA